jgi:multimeric flavodoxin WrbA
MRIVLLDGNPWQPSTSPPQLASPKLDAYLEQLGSLCTSAGHTWRAFQLRTLKYHFCTGCLSCFTRTPGRCAHKDDMQQVRQEVIRSDLLLFASPLLVGFSSALLKKACDRLVPLVHPYVEVVNGECHHVARYPHYPAIGMLIDPSGFTNRDCEIVLDVHRRLAINLKSSLVFGFTTEKTEVEIFHEIDGIERLTPG